MDSVGKKPGRLSKAIISQAYALRQKYHADLQHLATKEGKTVTSLLLAVGDTLPDGRALNTWNAFQAYATHPEGLKMECQEGQSPTEFQESIRAAYRKKQDGAEDVEEAFADVVEWYMERLSAQTANSRMKGLSEKKLKDIAKPFNNRVSFVIWIHNLNVHWLILFQGRQAYEVYQVSVFGWVVDAVSAKAIAFGADPLFKAMRDAEPTHMKNQSVNYGTMIHTQLMKQLQGGDNLDPAKGILVNRFHKAGNNHELLRGILKDVWLESLSVYLAYFDRHLCY